MAAYTAVAQSYLTGSHDLVTGLGGSVGFGENSLARNDDGSTAAIDITSIFGVAGLDFFGTNYPTIYLNNNGNITFANPNPEFTPTAITGGTNNPIIAAYWADVDTRGPSGAVTPGGTSRGTNLLYYDLDTVNRTFTATWDDVGYFDANADKQNAFQIQLVAQTDGTFDIVYRYENISWSAGDASGGSGGLGGTAARAGYSSGDGNAYFELPQSGNETQMLALDDTVGNTGIAGLWDFHVASGNGVVRGTPAPDILFGGGNSDTILGYASDDQLFGGNGNDSLAGGAGNDFIDGGSGVNTAFYQGARTEYTITPGTTPRSWTVADSNALRDGTDSLINIDNISFAPMPVYRFFDTHDGGHFFTQSTTEQDTVLMTRPDLRPEGTSFLALDQGNPLATPVYRFFDANDGGHFFTTSATERDTVLATRPDLRPEGVGFMESAVAASDFSPVFRFFDVHDGGHFFTQSTVERDTALATRPDLRPEGIAFYAPTDSAPVPVYRFFDTHDGGHFFTQSTTERDTVLITRPDLRPEGMSFLALDQGNPLATPVYRFFDANDGGHFFTTSATERDTVLATRPDLRPEGVGFLESAVAASDFSPVFRFFDVHDGGHFFTQSTVERDTALATRPDLRPEGIAFYAPTGAVDNIFSL